MGNADEQTWEQALIADMREHEGRPASGPLAGHPLMLMQGISRTTTQIALTEQLRHRVLPLVELAIDADHSEADEVDEADTG